MYKQVNKYITLEHQLLEKRRFSHCLFINRKRFLLRWLYGYLWQLTLSQFKFSFKNSLGALIILQTCQYCKVQNT
ncbi:unnamed protein product [Paramecium octaurelia]|uniref:Uncharacterized protein n=1 Tax=Paramecium octaurelia TaxID=43137 RepID=A0A8S1W3Y9_PAROT|nr:unnamed protein product [Paramecium octaurelia]